MGKLGIPTRNSKPVYSAHSNETLYYSKGNNYSNINAVENLIRYITRTRKNETRGRDLLCYGAVGAVNYLSPQEIIRQFVAVQEVHRIDFRRGRRMYHEVFNIRNGEAEGLFFDPNELWLVGFECSQEYFRLGYQTVFAVHWEPEKHFHIHFAVNSISYLNGNKFHTTIPEIQIRENRFNEILYARIHALRGDAYVVPNLEGAQIFMI